MAPENIQFAAVCGFCALLFAAVALWAFKRRGPMHFWAGSAVRPEEITDVPAYNRANGILWAVYAACMAAVGAVALAHVIAAAILLTIVCVPGVAVIFVVYKQIYRKYKR